MRSLTSAHGRLRKARCARFLFPAASPVEGFGVHTLRMETIWPVKVSGACRKNYNREAGRIGARAPPLTGAQACRPKKKPTQTTRLAFSGEGRSRRSEKRLNAGDARGPESARECRACLRRCSPLPDSPDAARFANSSEMPLPPNMSRASRAMSSALPHVLRFMIEVISTAAVPSSFMRPRRSTPCRPSVISVCMSASFF